MLRNISNHITEPDGAAFTPPATQAAKPGAGQPSTKVASGGNNNTNHNAGNNHQNGNGKQSRKKKRSGGGERGGDDDKKSRKCAFHLLLCSFRDESSATYGGVEHKPL